jgi:hypothetical protein
MYSMHPGPRDVRMSIYDRGNVLALVTLSTWAQKVDVPMLSDKCK